MSLIKQLNDAVPKMTASSMLIPLAQYVSTPLVAASANRWGIGIALPSVLQAGEYVLVDINPIATANTQGISLSPNVPIQWFSFKDFGALVTSAWYAYTAGVGVGVTVYTLDMIDSWDK